MEKATYALCALTASLCAILLLRAYFRTRFRLLLWSGLCFVGLTFNNFLVVLDRLVYPEVSLLLLRQGTALLSILLLLAGLILESDE